MSKVTWSVPLVQFGRCEVEVEMNLDWLADPQKFGADYARFVAEAMKGYEAQREKIAAELAERKTARDLTRDTQENYNAPAEAPPEPTEEEAQELIENELGATVVGKTPVWDEPVQESPKPWKGSGPVKKITDITF